MQSSSLLHLRHGGLPTISILCRCLFRQQYLLQTLTNFWRLFLNICRKNLTIFCRNLQEIKQLLSSKMLLPEREKFKYSNFTKTLTKTKRLFINKVYKFITQLVQIICYLEILTLLLLES